MKQVRAFFSYGLMSCNAGDVPISHRMLFSEHFQLIDRTSPFEFIKQRV